MVGSNWRRRRFALSLGVGVARLRRAGRRAAGRAGRRAGAAAGPALGAALALGLIGLPAERAWAEDGSYGRLEGDLGLSLEVGMSQALGSDYVEGQSLAVRSAAVYLQTVGLALQYNDSLGADAQPLERSVYGGVELRPLFLGRFASDLERGPAHFDLLLDSIALGIGVYGSWTAEPPCVDDMPSCFDHGIDLGLGLELPLLARASTPYLALHGSLRLSLAEDRLVDQPMSSGMLTVTIGYRHLFEAHIVDAADPLGD